MPAFSAFTGFGHLRFSSRPAHGQRMYEDMVRALGDGKNYSVDFNSLAAARLYANALMFARALNAAQRAGQQFRPSRALELLPALEKEYGITPEPDETIADRRPTVAALARVPRGARKDNVDAVMSELLGDDFIAYRPTPKTEAVLGPNRGVYVKPGTPRSVFKTLGAITTLGTPTTVSYTPVSGALTRLYAGDRIIIDAGHHDRIEAITVTAATTTTFTATFTKAHDEGVHVATGRHPYFVSTKRHNVFVLSSTAMRSARIRRKANRIIRRLLRGVSTWSLTEETSPGVVGPFEIGVGQIDITHISEITL